MRLFWAAQKGMHAGAVGARVGPSNRRAADRLNKSCRGEVVREATGRTIDVRRVRRWSGGGKYGEEGTMSPEGVIVAYWVVIALLCWLEW